MKEGDVNPIFFSSGLHSFIHQSILFCCAEIVEPTKFLTSRCSTDCMGCSCSTPDHDDDVVVDGILFSLSFFTAFIIL